MWHEKLQIFLSKAATNIVQYLMTTYFKLTVGSILVRYPLNNTAICAAYLLHSHDCYHPWSPAVLPQRDKSGPCFLCALLVPHIASKAACAFLAYPKISYGAIFVSHFHYSECPATIIDATAPLDSHAVCFSSYTLPCHILELVFYFLNFKFVCSHSTTISTY